MNKDNVWLVCMALWFALFLFTLWFYGDQDTIVISVFSIVILINLVGIYFV